MFTFQRSKSNVLPDSFFNIYILYILINICVDLIIRLAAKYGLKLVEKTRFEDFFNREKDRGKDLLIRMKALEVTEFYFCTLSFTTMIITFFFNLGVSSVFRSRESKSKSK